MNNAHFATEAPQGLIPWRRLCALLGLAGLLVWAYASLARDPASLTGPDLGVAAALLPDGRVLLAGGYETESLRLFDPASGRIRALAMPEGRAAAFTQEGLSAGDGLVDLQN